MVLILQVGDVQKALVIYKAALHCIFLSSLRGWERETFLKYYDRKPYSVMGRKHFLQSSYL